MTNTTPLPTGNAANAASDNNSTMDVDDKSYKSYNPNNDANKETNFTTSSPHTQTTTSDQYSVQPEPNKVLTSNEVDNMATDIQNKLQEAHNEISRLKTELENSEQNCKDFQDALSKQSNLYERERNEEYEQKIRDLKPYVTKCKELDQTLQKEKISYEKSYNELKQKFENQNMTLQESQKRSKELEQKLNEKKSQISLLKQRNSKLENETSDYQSALGVATNLKMSDEDRNHNVQLNGDILSLQDKIDGYVTNLSKSKVDVKFEEIIKLLPLYECQIKIDLNKPDKLFIKAILQRHVLEIIFGFANDYFSHSEKDYYLESDVVRKTGELYKLMKMFAYTRGGTDEITKVTPIKLRQLIYTALGMRGLGDIIEKDKLYIHDSIDEFKKSLNNSMNQYRVIKDPKLRKYADELAEILIQEVFRIFYFRLKVQEPVAEFHWFKSGDKVSKITMKASWDDDEFDDLVVELCIFPLIGQFTNSNQKVFTPAKVFTRHVPKPNTIKERILQKVDSVGQTIKNIRGKSTDQVEQPNNNSTEQNTASSDESNYHTPTESYTNNENDVQDEKQSPENEKHMLVNNEKSEEEQQTETRNEEAKMAETQKENNEKN